MCISKNDKQFTQILNYGISKDLSFQVLDQLAGADAMLELHRVSTIAIVACNIARNLAGSEASSTSAAFHATIALCLPPATLHAMVRRKKKLLANQISLLT